MPSSGITSHAYVHHVLVCILLKHNEVASFVCEITQFVICDLGSRWRQRQPLGGNLVRLSLYALFTIFFVSSRISWGSWAPPPHPCPGWPASRRAERCQNPAWTSENYRLFRQFCALKSTYSVFLMQSCNTIPLKKGIWHIFLYILYICHIYTVYIYMWHIHCSSVQDSAETKIKLRTVTDVCFSMLF